MFQYVERGLTPHTEATVALMQNMSGVAERFRESECVCIQTPTHLLV